MNANTVFCVFKVNVEFTTQGWGSSHLCRLPSILKQPCGIQAEAGRRPAHTRPMLVAGSPSSTLNEYQSFVCGSNVSPLHPQAQKTVKHSVNYV